MYTEKKRQSPIEFFKDSVLDVDAINFWLQHANRLWSVNQALGKIVEKKTITQDMVSIKIQVNRHFKMGIAGQHHPIFIEINGRRYERTYSLTQLDDKHVQLAVKKVAGGEVSTWLIEQVKKGDVIAFGEPYGDMQSAASPDDVVLLAAGSGITPMYSLVHYWAQHKHLLAKPVTLLYWVKTEQDAAFKAEFEALAQRFPKFKFKVFFTQAEQADARLNQADVESIANLGNSTIYACGPSGFVAHAEQLFAQAKVFSGEAFSLSPMINNDVGFVKITLSRSNQVINIPKGQAILPSLEQQNIKPNFGCRMGVCNKCVCKKIEGGTKNLVNGLENTEPNAQLKICVNSAQSDLTIDL